MTCRLDDEALQAITENEKSGHQDQYRHIRIDASQGIKKESRIERQHQQAAMRKIDDVQHAIDQRQSERDEGVNRPRRHSIQHGG